MKLVYNIRDKIHFIFPHGERGFYLGIQVPHKEAAEELLMTRPSQISHFSDVFLPEKRFRFLKEIVLLFSTVGAL